MGDHMAMAAPLRAPLRSSCNQGHRAQRADRPLRVVSMAVVMAGAASALLGLSAKVSSHGLVFCGSGGLATRLSAPEAQQQSLVAMNTIWYERPPSIGVVGGYSKKSKPKNRAGATFNGNTLMQWRMKPPSVPNLKDRYFILWVRSTVTRQWKPFNLVSDTQLGKTLETVQKNEVAKAIGVSKLAGDQMVKQIGMSIYKDLPGVKKTVLEMHPTLATTKELQFGYKEIPDNEKFNKEPFKILGSLNNVTIIPPEKELRNLLDDAGEAISSSTGAISKASDNVKSFFSGLGR